MTRRRIFSRGGGISRQLAALLVATVAAVTAQLGFAPVASAAGYVPISVAGSTWSANAVYQWVANVKQYGMVINTDLQGSTDGRNKFKAGTTDFAISEIPYGLSDGGVYDDPPKRTFGYMPIVAGGTSFMYNLKIGANRVTNLRLSGQSLAKIFTGQITNWADPAIKADNPSLALPARKIVPVVRSDGSGTTAQFTMWMANQYPDIWNAYCQRAGRTATPCGFTSFYPLTSTVVAQSGSNGVAGYVGQDANEGTITYVEYSYAIFANYPVAKILNRANYYVEPTDKSVAVALLAAKIHPDLTQDLTGVYNDSDARAYPLSSYSYLVVPQDNANGFNNDKGHTLGDFAYYFLCEGQQQVSNLGYSPLPVNLVSEGINQVNKIPGATQHDPNSLSQCHNPTVAADGSNALANTAPQPSECDKLGVTQCSTGTAGAKQSTPVSAGTPGAAANGATPGAATSGATPRQAAGGTAGSAPGADAGAGSSAGNAPAAGDVPAGAGGVDPNTGQPVGAGYVGAAVAAPVTVDLPNQGQTTLLAVVGAAVLLGLVIAPPLVARTLRKGDRS